MPMRYSFTLGVLLACRAGCAQAPQAPAVGGPLPETLREFEAYVRLAKASLDARLQDQDGFLWGVSAAKRARVQSEGALCEPRSSKGDVKVAGGLIHDWVGAAFLPGANVKRVLALVQDYDNHKKTYKPDVLDSKTLERQGDDFKVRMRLREQKMMVTVVMDADFDVQYQPLGGGDWRSSSHSTRIVEIANPGGARERERTPKEDRGFLWRLNSYWLFRQRDGGVYVECEAISLSRGVPAVLEYFIDPIIHNMPRDILGNTLRATRRLALADLAGGAGKP